MDRPRPPEEMLYPMGAPDFMPASDLWGWAREAFIAEGAYLENAEHAHLRFAKVGSSGPASATPAAGR